MENASKALIMAAGILLGVMIVSIAVYLFSVYGEYSSDAYAKIEKAQIDQFNTKFLKYYGTRTNNKDEEEQVLCTAHDIITLANLAKQNNIDEEVNDLPEEERNDEINTYIRIDLKTKINNIMKNIYYIERLGDEERIKFIKDHATHKVKIKDKNGRYIYDENGKIVEEEQTKYYICTKAEISRVTKKVYYMLFEEK